jgi:ABC-type thiamine transport system ATPase subunit
VNDQQRMQIARAEHADRILNDPLVMEAFQAIEKAIRDQVFDLPIEAVEQREKLVLMDKSRQQFVNLFELAVRGGEVTRHELAAEANTKARIQAIREQARSYAG